MKLKTRHNWLLALAVLASFFTLPTKAQVNIGSEEVPREYSILELNSINRGLRMPHLNTTQRTAISDTWKNSEPEKLKGLWIYNTDINCLEFWGGDIKGWVSLCPGNSGPCASAIIPLSGYSPLSRRDTLDCVKLTTQLSITVSVNPNDYTYQWYHYTNGIIIGATTPTCTVNTAGDYYCIVKPKCSGDRIASMPFTVVQSPIIPLPVFMSYNLGADPTKNDPKAQMQYLSTQSDPLDATVYGGLFQWGRRTMKYAVNSRTTPRMRYTGVGLANHSAQIATDRSSGNSNTYTYNATYDPVTGQILTNPGNYNPFHGTDDCDTVHVSIGESPPGEWRGRNGSNTLWGNGFTNDYSTGTIGNNASFGAIGVWPNNDKRYQRPIKTINDPCPKGYRVPTQDEWERLSDYCDPSRPNGALSQVGEDGYFTHTGIYNTTTGLTWVAVRCSDGHCRANPNLWTKDDPGGYAIYLTSTWSSADAVYKNGSEDLFAIGAPTPIIFLPANGSRANATNAETSAGLFGNYWSSSVYGNTTYSDTHMSFYLLFGNSYVMPMAPDWRGSGFGIRCVENGLAEEPCRYAEILEYIPESRTAVISSSNPSVTLSIVVDYPSEYNYQWYNSTHAITGGDTQSVSVSMEDTYYCKVTPKDCPGYAIDSKKFTVTTGVSPVANVTIDACVNTMYNFQYQTLTAYSTSGGTANAWQWYQRQRGASSYSTISGATAVSYTIPVNTYNGGIEFMVEAWNSGNSSHVQSALLDIEFIATSGDGVELKAPISVTGNPNTGGVLNFHYLNLGSDRDSPNGPQNACDFGDLYQWGRVHDGHQKVTWIKHNVGDDVSFDDSYTSGKVDIMYELFPSSYTITYDNNSPSGSVPFYQVTSPQHIGKFLYKQPYGLWNITQGGLYPAAFPFFWITETYKKTPNDPCETGWRVPTQYEWAGIFKGVLGDGLPTSATQNTWTWRAPTGNRILGGMIVSSGDGSDKSKRIFLPAIGYRDGTDGLLYIPSTPGTSGHYWGSTSAPGGSNYGHSLSFRSDLVSVLDITRDVKLYGLPVRCVKEVEPTPLASGILYFDSSDGNRLKIGAAGEFPKADMAFVKFGSVVAYTHTGFNWVSSYIKFNPTSTNHTDYTWLPRFNADGNGVPNTNDFANGGGSNILNISDPVYHKGTNVMIGKGDICKLVGLTANDVKGMNSSQIDSYNSGYRLPTSQEAINYTGGNGPFQHSTNNFYSSIIWSGSPFNVASYPPAGTASNPVILLPAAGAYIGIGTDNYNVNGYYWSSTPSTSTAAYGLHFTQTSLSSSTTQDPINTRSYAIRCVKNTP